MRELSALVLVCAISLCFAGQDLATCTQDSLRASRVGVKPFPPMPDVFAVDIQMNVAVNKTTRRLFELFDSPNSRAMVGETESAGPYNNISLTGYDLYNFYSNQIVELINLPDGAYCTASQLDGKGVDTFIFGESVTSATGFNAATAFRIRQDKPPVYMGKKTLESGAMTEVWKDCHYIIALDATVVATWYFSEAGTWNTSLGVTQVPMMLKIYGILFDNSNPKGRRIDHSYTFVGFTDYITDRQQEFFKVPQGTVCPFLKNFDVKTRKDHNIPELAKDGFFSFGAEFVQKTGPQSSLVTGIREYYDSTLMLSRFDYTPQGFLTTFVEPDANHPLSEVHDFLTGLAYIRDIEHGNCTVVPLALATRFDVIAGAGGNHVRMKTVKEFFGISGTEGSSMNWTYTGQRKLRDITADVFIAERLGYPAGSDPKTKSIWEIAFTADGVYDVATTSTSLQSREPIRLWVKIPDYDYEMTYNIFDFDESEPDAWMYDVSDCYPDENKTNVMFKLPATHKDLMEKNRKQFTYWLIVDILGYLDLSPIRMANLRWFVDDHGPFVTVQFQILDPPTIHGSTNDQIPVNYLNPTTVAVQLLRKAINQGKFIVEVGSADDGTIIPVVAVRYSALSERLTNTTVTKYLTRNNTVTNTNTVYKLQAGPAAGLAIGLFVAGLLVGVLAIFLVNKCRATSLPNLTMSFTPSTFQNEK